MDAIFDPRKKLLSAYRPLQNSYPAAQMIHHLDAPAAFRCTLGFFTDFGLSALDGFVSLVLSGAWTRTSRSPKTTRKCVERFKITSARAIDRDIYRLRLGPPSARMSRTNRRLSSIFKSLALASALFNVFSTKRAAFLFKRASVSRARFTGLKRT